MAEICERCGVELPEGASYCRRCGRRSAESWAVPAARDRVDGPANAFSTLGVFFGVVAVVNLVVGLVALVLAGVAAARREPSSRFALAVAGGGVALGVVVRQVLESG